MMKKLYTFTIILFVVIKCNVVQSQSLYDINTVRTIYLNFYDSNWDAILDTFMVHNLDSQVLADLIVDGIKYDSVGVKFKGNSSYNPKQKKNPFNVDINYVKNQNLYGYTTLKLSNMFKDPSCVREVLSYEMLRNYMPAPQANYVLLYTDSSLLGFYTSVENVNNNFLDKHFGSNNNSFFKCDPITITGTPQPPPPGCPPVMGISSSLIYLSNDTACYEQHYEIKSDYGWTKLMNMITQLNNNPSQVAQFLDVDRALWMLVYNNIFVNMDSYTGSGHNYYIYENDYQRFNTIIWDLNENFGVFTNGGGPPPSQLSIAQMQSLDPLWNVTNTKRPLIKKILEISNYNKRYFAHYRTIMNDFLAGDSLKNRADYLRSFIDTYVANDPNKLYTYVDFQNAMNQNVGNIVGINVLMDTRYDTLLNNTDINKVSPAITNVHQSTYSPSANDSVWIIAEISNVTQAWLVYKDNLYASFTSVLMYDDGNHHDSVAGDNIFGAVIPAFGPTTFVYYYIYAENNDAGMFSPEKAEYVCYSYNIQPYSHPAGDLVINEIMASNSGTAADQDGEYNDWIELYNNTSQDIVLTGMHLSDDFGKPSRWIFPDTVIKANDYLIVWADADTLQQGLHTDFKLSKSGEQVILSNSAGTMLDSITFYQQYTDTSYGRYPNGTGNYQYMPATFNNANNCFAGITEITHTDKAYMLIYPNPAKDIINIEYYLPDEQYKYMEFYNIMAQKIMEYPVSTGKHTVTIPLHEFDNGIYIVRTGSVYKKIIVNK